jgi:DNA-binding GntR family transcriptional regulator
MKELCENQDYVNYSKNNALFHVVSYKASKKDVISTMITEIKTQLSRYQIKTMLVPGRTEESLKEHRVILESLKEKDMEKAVKAITEHLSNVSRTISKYIKIFY